MTEQAKLLFLERAREEIRLKIIPLGSIELYDTATGRPTRDAVLRLAYADLDRLYANLQAHEAAGFLGGSTWTQKWLTESNIILMRYRSLVPVNPEDQYKPLEEADRWLGETISLIASGVVHKNPAPTHIDASAIRQMRDGKTYYQLAYTHFAKAGGEAGLRGLLQSLQDNTVLPFRTAAEARHAGESDKASARALGEMLTRKTIEEWIGQQGWVVVVADRINGASPVAVGIYALIVPFVEYARVTVYSSLPENAANTVYAEFANRLANHIEVSDMAGKIKSIVEIARGDPEGDRLITELVGELLGWFTELTQFINDRVSEEQEKIGERPGYVLVAADAPMWAEYCKGEILNSYDTLKAQFDTLRPASQSIIDPKNLLAVLFAGLVAKGIYRTGQALMTRGMEQGHLDASWLPPGTDAQMRELGVATERLRQAISSIRGADVRSMLVGVSTGGVEQGLVPVVDQLGWKPPHWMGSVRWEMAFGMQATAIATTALGKVGVGALLGMAWQGYMAYNIGRWISNIVTTSTEYIDYTYKNQILDSIAQLVQSGIDARIDNTYADIEHCKADLNSNVVADSIEILSTAVGEILSGLWGASAALPAPTSVSAIVVPDGTLIIDHAIVSRLFTIFHDRIQRDKPQLILSLADITVSSPEQRDKILTVYEKFWVVTKRPLTPEEKETVATTAINNTLAEWRKELYAQMNERTTPAMVSSVISRILMSTDDYFPGYSQQSLILQCRSIAEQGLFTGPWNDPNYFWGSHFTWEVRKRTISMGATTVTTRLPVFIIETLDNVWKGGEIVDFWAQDLAARWPLIPETERTLRDGHKASIQGGFQSYIDSPGITEPMGATLRLVLTSPLELKMHFEAWMTQNYKKAFVDAWTDSYRPAQTMTLPPLEEKP